MSDPISHDLPFPFGRYAGRRLSAVWSRNPAYCRWCLLDVRHIGAPTMRAFRVALASLVLDQPIEAFTTGTSAHLRKILNGDAATARPTGGDRR